MERSGCQERQWQSSKNLRDRFSDRKRSAGHVQCGKMSIKLRHSLGKFRSGEPFRSPIVEKVPGVQIIDHLIRCAAERGTENAHQRESIVRIVNRAKQVDSIDDLPGAVEVAFSFDDIPNSTATQRLEIVVNICQFSEKKSDILRLYRGGLPVTVAERDFSEHLILQPRRETFAFDTPRLFCVQVAGFGDDFPDENGWQQRRVISADLIPSRMYFNVRWLNPRGRFHHRPKDRIDNADYRLRAPEVRGQTALGPALGFDDVF